MRPSITTARQAGTRFMYGTLNGWKAELALVLGHILRWCVCPQNDIAVASPTHILTVALPSHHFTSLLWASWLG